MTHQYEYARPALTVDAVVFGYTGEELQVLLIERGEKPFQGKWALPGGFVRMEETLEEAVARELKEETGLEKIFLEQLYTFGRVDRDPRDRTVSVAYFALVKPSAYALQPATDAKDARWFSVDAVPPLAFDHSEILETALKRLRGKIRYEPIGFELLPPAFTLTALQQLYECLLDEALDKRNFRKKILSLGLLVELNQTQKDVAHRAAALYRFDGNKYRRLKKSGFNFEI
ncbi:MAG: NUDIX domain-containing protein [bacterium]